MEEYYAFADQIVDTKPFKINIVFKLKKIFGMVKSNSREDVRN